MRNKERIFKLREEHVRYLYKLMKDKEEEYFNKYGEDYKSYFRENENSRDLDLNDTVKEYYLVNYILQRAENMIKEYDKINAENNRI